MFKRILMLPIRFLTWLTTDTGRRRPGYGETQAQFETAQASTHLSAHDREEELRRHADEARQHQKAAASRREE